MIINVADVLPIILLIVLIVLVIICIVLGIKLIGTLNKVDVIIDDVNSKMGRIDGVFTIIDKTTDYASGISDKIINGISSFLTLMFKKKERKECVEDEKEGIN